MGEKASLIYRSGWGIFTLGVSHLFIPYGAYFTPMLRDFTVPNYLLKARGSLAFDPEVFIFARPNILALMICMSFIMVGLAGIYFGRIADDQSYNKCPDCSIHYAKDKKFCTKCGAELIFTTTNKRSRVGLILRIMVVILTTGGSLRVALLYETLGLSNGDYLVKYPGFGFRLVYISLVGFIMITIMLLGPYLFSRMYNNSQGAMPPQVSQ